MENKIESARIFVLQAKSYYEQNGETPDDDEIKNDAANIFGETYAEYQEILSAIAFI